LADQIITAEDLRALAAGLRQVAPATEQEFLDLGGRLRELTSRASAVSGDAGRIVAISGSGEDDEVVTIGAAIAVFDRVHRDIVANRDAFGYCRTIIDDLISRLKKLSSLTAVTERIGKQIRMLGINLKIESARFHQEGHGFAMLARSVAAIAEAIAANSREFEDGRSETCRKIESFRAEINRYTGEFLHKSEQSGAALAKHLDLLRSMMAESAAAADQLVEGGKRIGDGVGDIVMAMQFHDITRQQLDNVAQSIDDLAAEIVDGGDPARDRSAAVRLYQGLTVQYAQINSVVEAIQHARANITGGLEQTRAVLSSIRGSVSGGGGSGQDRKVVIAHLAKEAGRIGDFLEEGLRVASVMGEIVGQVIASTATMEKFLDEIETVSLDVKLLALNALIEAARIGEAGRTLDVLAQELNFMARNTIEAIAESVRELEEMLASTKRYEEFNSSFQEKQRRTSDTMRRTADLAGQLEASAEEIARLSAACDRETEALARDIEEIAAGLRFPEIMVERLTGFGGEVAAVLDRMEELFPGIEEELGTIGTDAGGDTEKYVMERERVIHEQVLGSAAAGAAAAMGGDAGEADIVLFDAEAEGRVGAVHGDAVRPMEETEAASWDSADGDIELWDAPADGAAGEAGDERPLAAEDGANRDNEFGDNVELF